MAAAYGKDGKVDWEKFHEIVKARKTREFSPVQGLNAVSKVLKF
jgi:hypothetical protein